MPRDLALLLQLRVHRRPPDVFPWYLELPLVVALPQPVIGERQREARRVAVRVREALLGQQFAALRQDPLPQPLQVLR